MKKRLEGIGKEVAAKKILEQGKYINALTRVELMTLLKWHGFLKQADFKVEERRAKWIAISQSGKAASSNNEWTTEEEAALIKLKAEPMLMKETVLGA